MAERGEDRLLDAEVPTVFDLIEWRWDFGQYPLADEAEGEELSP
jgi:hypothetical protein